MMLTFFDTNVLVYLFDTDSPEKADRAKAVFGEAVEEGRFVISTQVLQEFYVTVTRKLAVPLSVVDAEEAVRGFAELSVTPVDVPQVLAAIGRSRTMQISFWDALIIEAALSVGATRLLTEDLQHGCRFDGLRVENPFL